MAYGVQTFDSLGRLTFDSNQRVALVFSEFTAPVSTSVLQVNYPELAGREIRYIASPVTVTRTIFGKRYRLNARNIDEFIPSLTGHLPQITVDYAQGFPRITVKYYLGQQTYYTEVGLQGGEMFSDSFASVRIVVFVIK